MNIRRIVFYFISIASSLVLAFLPIIPIPGLWDTDAALLPWFVFIPPTLIVSIIFRKLSIQKGSAYRFSYFDFYFWGLFIIIGIILIKKEESVLETLYTGFIWAIVAASILQVVIPFYIANLFFGKKQFEENTNESNSNNNTINKSESS
jgi:hypothetical protein